MARYTETLMEYIQNGNKLPEVFNQIDGLSELFISKFLDMELGFETEDLFRIKLDALASVYVPLYTTRLEMYESALNKAKNPIKQYEDNGSSTINGGARKSSSTEVPIDTVDVDPTMISEQQPFVDNNKSNNVHTETGMTVTENYMVLDKLQEKCHSIKMELLDHFKVLFMKVYF